MPKASLKSDKSLASTRQRAGEIFQTLAAANPHPQGELHWTNPYNLLVAVTLSAQATDKAVNLVTAKLFPVASSPQAMLDLGEEGLKAIIKTLGLFNSKAKHIIEAAKILIEEFKGEVPSTREELQRLPGVGRKTANVVLNIAFGQPTLAVDTHILRVSKRLGLSQSDDPLRVEQDLLAVIDPNYLQHAHHWLILHGRYQCQARKPHCTTCPLQRMCPSFLYKPI